MRHPNSFFFFSSRRRHTRYWRDWSSDVCSSDLGGPVVGWFNTRLWDETGDEERAQGWTALVLDINGNGRRDEYTEPNAPVDPAKDKRIARSEERRVGKGCRSRGSPDHLKKKRWL